MITLRIYVEDIDDRIEDFDSIRVFRDTSPDGSFATLVTTITLVADQTLYTYDDENGDGDSWYRYAFRNSSTTAQSDYSPPFRPGGNTLSRLTFLVAHAAGAAFEGVTSGVSSSTTLVDELLRDVGFDEGFLNGSWVKLPADDTIRGTAANPFSTSTGAIEITRPWTAPGAGAAYQVFALLPPKRMPGTVYSWEDAVRDGLRYCWFEDRIIVGTGDGETWQFSLTAHPSLRDENRRRGVYSRRTVDDQQVDVDLMRGPSWWTVRNDGTNAPILELPYRPGTDEKIVVAVARQPDVPYRSDDYIEIPEDIAVLAGVLAAYRRLNRMPGTRGNYSAELGGAASEFNAAYERIRPRDVILQ